MRIENEFTRRFDLSCPVIQAPMAGGGDTAELVAAVSNSGGLGFAGAAYLTPDQMLQRGREIRALTSRPFGVNLFAPVEGGVPAPERIRAAIERISAYYDELGLPAPADIALPDVPFDSQVDAALEMGAQAFSFTFGSLPRTVIERIKDRKLFTAGTATTVNEAKALFETGVDAVIAQGSEAGGHRGTFTSDFQSAQIGSIALIPQIARAVPVPVIASGGVMDGRGIAAALMLGAMGVQMGTAFLTCDEAGVPEAYKAAMFAATEEDTRITRAFSGRPARGIANRFLMDYEKAEENILPFPFQNVLTRALRNEARRRERAEYLSLWAGQGVGLARRGSAAALLTELRSELDQAFRRFRICP